MSNTNFRVMMTVSRDGTVTGDYWPAIRTFEQAGICQFVNAKERERLAEYDTTLEWMGRPCKKLNKADAREGRRKRRAAG